MKLIHELVDYGFDEMRLSSQVDIMDAVIRTSSARTSAPMAIHRSKEKHSPNDVISVFPIRPNGIHHDLGLSDGSFNRRVVPDIYDD